MTKALNGSPMNRGACDSPALRPWMHTVVSVLAHQDQ